LYELFSRSFSESTSIHKPPAFDLIRRTYTREVDKIIEYYQTRPMAVASNHLLCRLLTTAEIPYRYDLRHFMDVAYDRASHIGKLYGFTSAATYGKIHDGVFFGPGNYELILNSEEDFDYEAGIKDWKNLKPVTILEHQISDLGLMLPDGKENSSGKGLCVLSVNIPMLLCQYRGFISQMKERSEKGDGGLLGTAHFVHMYVLPGMLYSQTDLVIMNRLTSRYYGAPMTEAYRKHPFMVTDYGMRVDMVVDEVIEVIKNQSLWYSMYLKNIPEVFTENAFDSLHMPDIARTRQAWWALLISRLGTIKFLVDIGGSKGQQANGNHIGKLKIEIKSLMRENMLKTMLPIDMYDEVMDICEELVRL
jgi:hypothetical protein